MDALGLSAEQLAERRLRLHAGDAPAIMDGDYRKVFRRIKFGEGDDLWPNLPWFVRKNMTPEQLDFAAAKGNYTEPLNLAVTMQKTGRPITYYSASMFMRYIWLQLTDNAPSESTELVICKRHPFMACNLDGMTTTPQGHRSVIDAKDISRAYEPEILKYTPLGTWQATCAGTDWWGLSLIVGQKWVEPLFQRVDPIYQATMIARAKECWGYIERDEEPPEAEAAPVLAPKPQPKRRTIDVPLNIDDPVFAALMQRENWLPEMVEAMGAFASTDSAAKRHAIARKDMDRLMPDDVGRVTRGRIKAVRDGRGFSASLEKRPSDADVG
jgi:hypothetical protein